MTLLDLSQHKPDPVTLFGGLLDLIETSRDFSPALNHVKISALLFDSIIVQDSWFFCDGPVVRHLRSLGDKTEAWENDDFVQFIASGIVRPALRTGSSLLDVWEGGESTGVKPGDFLTITKTDGDSFIGRVSSFAERANAHVGFPKPLIEKNKSLFGLAVERFLREDLEPMAGPGDFYLLSGDIEIQRFVHSFREFVTANMSANFRRGQVEQFLASSTGLPRFSYDALEALSGQSKLGSVAFALAQDVSTLYAGTQSQLFKVRPQAFHNHDSRLMDAYLLGVENVILQVMPNCVLDLNDAFAPQYLSAADVMFIRDKLEDGALFKKALGLMRRCSLLSNEQTFGDLVAFLQGHYIPAIVRQFPRVRVSRYASSVSSMLNAIHELSDRVNATAAAADVLLGITVSAKCVASTCGAINVAKLLEHVAAVLQDGDLSEINAGSFFISHLTKSLDKKAGPLAEAAQQRWTSSEIRRRQKDVATWARPLRNNYLTERLSK
jgi:hypothetical protein